MLRLPGIEQPDGSAVSGMPVRSHFMQLKLIPRSWLACKAATQSLNALKCVHASFSPISAGSNPRACNPAVNFAKGSLADAWRCVAGLGASSPFASSFGASRFISSVTSLTGFNDGAAFVLVVTAVGRAPAAAPDRARTFERDAGEYPEDVPLPAATFTRVFARAFLCVPESFLGAAADPDFVRTPVRARALEPTPWGPWAAAGADPAKKPISDKASVAIRKLIFLFFICPPNVTCGLGDTVQCFY